MPRLANVFKKNTVENATYTYPSGDKYTGSWLNGRKHGFGVAEFVSGNRYEGNWDNDFKHGKGTITFVDGTTYTGEWCKDHKHGYGEARFASGNRYEGNWVDDAMEGQGTFYYARGDVYQGEWKSGKICGFGTWVSFDKSSKYEGNWLDGLRHGTGRLTENGRTLEVEYNMGHRVDDAYLEEQKNRELSAQANQSKPAASKEDKKRHVSPMQSSNAPEPKAEKEEEVNTEYDNDPDVTGNQDHDKDDDPELDEMKVKKKKKKKKKKNINQSGQSGHSEDDAQQDPFESGLRNKEQFNALLGQDGPSSSSAPFLPSIGRSNAQVSSNFSPSRAALPEAISSTSSQGGGSLLRNSGDFVGISNNNNGMGRGGFLPNVLPAAPPTRLPPLPGAPRAPTIGLDRSTGGSASYKRKQQTNSASNRHGKIGSGGGSSGPLGPLHVE